MRPMLILLLLLLAAPALAVDGVLEINQTCAVQTGCFAGDTAGYPVTISASGSYRLTSNLAGIGANTDGIFLNTSRVTIDFNGFSLAGFSIGSGTGNGIAGGGTDGSFAGFATIKNGVIRGFRANGIALGGARGVRVENMVLDFNTGRGIHVGHDARVLRNTASKNGALSTDGIVTGSGSLVVENVANGSGRTGIFSGSDSTVSRNTANDNGSVGINASSGSTVSGNTTYGNGTSGIWAFSGSTVSGNTARGNSGHGIIADDASTVRGNTVYANTGHGLNLGPTTAYRENTIGLNTAGAVTGGVNAGGNVCNGSLTCP